MVEAVKSLSLEEKEEIQLLLQHYLREARPEEIYNNFNSSQAEEQNGELKFSSSCVLSMLNIYKIAPNVKKNRYNSISEIHYKVLG